VNVFSFIPSFPLVGPAFLFRLSSGQRLLFCSRTPAFDERCPFSSRSDRVLIFYSMSDVLLELWRLESPPFPSLLQSSSDAMAESRTVRCDPVLRSPRRSPLEVFRASSPFPTTPSSFYRPPLSVLFLPTLLCILIYHVLTSWSRWRRFCSFTGGVQMFLFSLFSTLLSVHPRIFRPSPLSSSSPTGSSSFPFSSCHSVRSSLLNLHFLFFLALSLVLRSGLSD